MGLVIVLKQIFKYYIIIIIIIDNPYLLFKDRNHIKLLYNIHIYIYIYKI